MTELERRAVAGEATRTDRVVSWIGWHIGELTAVGLPLLLAVAITWWLLGVAVLAGGLWIAREVHRARQRHATTNPRKQKQEREHARQGARGEEASA
ncbi:hypothetical protein [Prauserella muralis]|uniref:Uncharacterized protein n=1 Tax=Prauserella muralis TaxID=588067 RepID=A0A2V4B7A0_9PSEU|nr:hypothetical protein [Prauserella muralis]PXY31107.1 hypothetical protein BAY60_01440 [Prauserella muralis]TWE14605.1 hypothetical protein FHX69_6762 [Prauserella muralis]